MEQNLKKELGLFTLVAIGLGAIIGSGIFALPAIMAAAAGPGLIVSILIAGLVTIFIALSYAELGSSFVVTGGPFAFPRMAFGDLTGFLMGWGYFLYLFVGTAAVVEIFIVYLGFYFPGLAEGTVLTYKGIGIGLIAIWLFTFINIFGVKWGGLYSVITTVGKLIPLAIFCLMGLMVIDGHNFTPLFPFGLAGVTFAVTLFFWSFTGFESIVVPIEEVKNPGKTIPWALILTMVITIIVYVLIAVTFIGLIDWRGLGLSLNDWQGIGELDFPLAKVVLASSALKASWLVIIVTIGAIIATGGSGGTWILIQGRLPFSMAKQNLFWSKMGKVNRFGVPTYSFVFTSILTSVVLIALPNFTLVSLIASMTAIIPYAAAALSVPILRKTKKEVVRPFRLPFHKGITLLAFIFSTWLLYWASWPWTVVGTFLFLLGYLAFFLVRTKNLDLGRTKWLITYLLGIITFSFLGDPRFEVDNFTNIHPLGLLEMPYDLLALALFSTLIYFWAYRTNSRR